VPGFAFGVDVQGVVGIGVRGNWGHEGKVLLLIDGQRANELLYSTTQFGGHYPADLIERVEIIRGPGSAVYGGFAELAVINVITRTPESLNGVNATARAGMMERTFGTQSFSAAFAQQIPKARGSRSTPRRTSARPSGATSSSSTSRAGAIRSATTTSCAPRWSTSASISVGRDFG
jgi:outer membrane receptor for ferrienterochelin and colicin